VSVTGYHVTCSTGTCYVGTAPANNTTYDLTIAQSGATWGRLEVASGATLWLTGNYKLSGSNGATSGGKLILDTGATFVHDNNNSSTVSYRGSTGTSNNMNQVLAGTAGDACTITGAFTYSCATNYKGVNVGGGVYPRLMAPTNAASVFSITAYGLGAQTCGATAAPCIDVAADALPITVDVEGSVFDHAVPIGSSYWYTNTTSSFIWKNNREVSDVAGSFSVNSINFMTNMATCVISGNYFDGTFNTGRNDPFGGCQFTYNVFAGSQLIGASSSHPWGKFSGNVLIQTQAQALDTASFIPVVGNFFHQIMAASGSAHMIVMPNVDFYYTGNICDRSGGYVTESHCLLTYNAGVHKAVIMDNLATMTSAGDPAGMFYLMANTNSGQAGALLYADHNGENGLAYDGWLGAAGHGGWYYQTNTALGSIRANIGWSPTSGSANYMWADWAGAAPSTLVDASSVANWNNTVNGSVSSMYPSSTFNGTAYQINSGTATLGSHETHLAPKYIDTGRRGETWASRVMGQAQSAAGLKAALWGCPNISNCVGSLMAWVSRGWQPTNVALKGAARPQRNVWERLHGDVWRNYHATRQLGPGRKRSLHAGVGNLHICRRGTTGDTG
jgi:hypothetical protein